MRQVVHLSMVETCPPHHGPKTLRGKDLHGLIPVSYTHLINAFLRGYPYEPKKKHPIVGFESLNVWYRTDAPKQEQPHVPLEEAAKDFTEIVKGLNESEAKYEASRCYSCGNCFECDGCYGACPEGAIIKLGPGKRYHFNYTLCTGCAVCFEQCPCPVSYTHLDVYKRQVYIWLEYNVNDGLTTDINNLAEISEIGIFKRGCRSRDSYSIRANSI